jgi:hypothetical protein
MNAVDTSRQVGFDLVLPEADYDPTLSTQTSEVALIPRAVASNLASPELRKACAPGRESIAMPEISIDKNDYSMPGQHDIRPAWKFLHVSSEPKPLSM